MRTQIAGKMEWDPGTIAVEPKKRMCTLGCSCSESWLTRLITDMQYGNFASRKLDICASEYTSPILSKLVISLVKNARFPRHVVPRQIACCESNF